MKFVNVFKKLNKVIKKILNKELKHNETESTLYEELNDNWNNYQDDVCFIIIIENE
jgi:hypothetical protein